MTGQGLISSPSKWINYFCSAESSISEMSFEQRLTFAMFPRPKLKSNKPHRSPQMSAHLEGLRRRGHSDAGKLFDEFDDTGDIPFLATNPRGPRHVKTHSVGIDEDEDSDEQAVIVSRVPK